MFLRFKNVVPFFNMIRYLIMRSSHYVVKSNRGTFPFLHLDKTESLINFNENLAENGFISFSTGELNKLFVCNIFEHNELLMAYNFSE